MNTPDKATDPPHRSYCYRDYSLAIALSAPLLSAGITVATVAIAELVDARKNAGPVVLSIAIVNAALGTAGAASGGFFVRRGPAWQVAVAIVSGATGLAVHAVAAAIGGYVVLMWLSFYVG